MFWSFVTEQNKRGMELRNWLAITATRVITIVKTRLMVEYFVHLAKLEFHKMF